MKLDPEKRRQRLTSAEWTRLDLVVREMPEDKQMFITKVYQKPLTKMSSSLLISFCFAFVLMIFQAFYPLSFRH
jgi:hypothetical protein